MKLKIRKKYIAMLLVLTLLNCCLGVNFASINSYVVKGTDGAEYIISILNDDVNEKITTVEYGDSKVKSILNKKTNTMSVYTLNGANTLMSKRSKQIESEKFLMNVDLNIKKPIQVKSYRAADSYASEHYPNYTFNMNGAYGMTKFNLTITNDSLTTPYVPTSSRIYENSYDFKECIQSADSYFDQMLLDGVGFIPSYAIMFAIADVLKDGKVTGDDIPTIVMLILTNAGWMGVFLNTALLISHGSLSAAQLYNAKTEFRNVKYAN